MLWAHLENKNILECLLRIVFKYAVKHAYLSRVVFVALTDDHVFAILFE